MELIDLKTHTRTTKGKAAAKALRRDGKIPAILYGKKDPMMLWVDEGELELVFKKSKTPQVFTNLNIGDGENCSAMIKEYQTDPTSQSVLHVDFLEIAMDQEINMFVPVTTTGKSIGVEMGGMLQLIRRELEIRCQPANVPEKIVIDVTSLDVGDSVHVNDIVPPEGVEIPADVNFTVVTIVAPKTVTGSEAEEGEEGTEEALATPTEAAPEE